MKAKCPPIVTVPFYKEPLTNSAQLQRSAPRSSEIIALTYATGAAKFRVDGA
jgi:hypothetical protein